MNSKARKLILGLIGLVAIYLVVSFSTTTMQGSISSAGLEQISAANIQNFDGGASLAATSRKFNLAFSNTLALDMPAASVAPRFTRARDACLNDPALKCILLNASLNLDTSAAARHYANLSLRLPHEAVKTFEDSVMAPLEGEKPGAVGVRDRSTRAEDLSRDVEDTETRLKQLSAYRDSLNELSAKKDAKLEDLLRLKKELAETQTQIEQITSRKRDITERIETELVTITLHTADGSGGNFAEVTKAWRKSGQTFGKSAGSFISFFFAILPWTPVILLVFYGLCILVREPKQKKED